MNAWKGLIIGVAVAGVGLLGGCNNKKGGVTLEQLQGENADLRAQLDMSESARSTCETARASLQAQLDAMANQSGGNDTGGFGSDTEIGGERAVARGGMLVVDLAGDVLFDSGQATLKSGAKGTLDRIASDLNSRFSGNTIKVAGHTDSDPLRKTKDKWTDNENLSAQRALAVERYLAERGVSRSRMFIAGYGPDEPKGGKKESRRVEIIVLGEGAQ